VSIGNGVLELAVLLASVILHENAHGVVALALGDKTAKAMGRITLDPVKHLDPLGSLLLPAFLYVVHAPVFGYAKPVPVTPRNLKGRDTWGFATVALAGPVCNLIIATVAVLLVKHMSFTLDAQGQPTGNLVASVLVFTFQLNLLLAAFNLLPIPPLDGSRLLRPVVGLEGRRVLDRVEPFGFVILLGLITLLGPQLFHVISLIESGLLHLLPV
jgi:Zn-dependent protease